MSEQTSRDYWKVIAKSAVKDHLAMVEETRRYMIDEAFPAIVERMAPAERQQVYQALDWNRLLERSPYLYAKLSKDAQQIDKNIVRRLPQSEPITQPTGIGALAGLV